MEIYRPQRYPVPDFDSDKPALHSSLRDDSYFLTQDKMVPSIIFPPDRPITTPEVVMIPNSAILDLTDFWDNGKYLITPVGGSVEIRSSLFIEKNTVFNYGYRQGAPEGISTLMWNSVEAIYEFGIKNLKPGDSIVFTEAIDMGDKLLPGESQHGEGYYGSTNGMCNASTTLSELFGTNIVLPDGSTVPLFIARPGSIQPHDMAHNPKYYEYAYHGPGVAVNSTPEGSLPFMVNPNLPESLRIQLSMSFTDTEPASPYSGVYKPQASVVIKGLPDGYKVEFQRLSANRSAQLQKMTGTQEYYTIYGKSVYFDKTGQPIISEEPIVYTVKEVKKKEFVTYAVDPDSDLRQVQLDRFESVTKVPKYNKLIYPGGVAHSSTKDKDGNIIWKARDGWLPLAAEDLPPPMESVSPGEYLRILVWNNVSDPDNLRYKLDSSGTSFCNVAILDWAQAYRVNGNESVPLPRWIGETKMIANALFDWLHSYQAEALGWKMVSAREASEKANQGYFTLVIARNNQGSGHVAIVTPGSGWTSPEGIFYPTTAQAGKENWGPQDAKTAFDSFQRIEKLNPENWSEPQYFVWIP